MQGNLHHSRFIVREAGIVFVPFYIPHELNSYLFSGIPQISVAADKNEINNPVLL